MVTVSQDGPSLDQGMEVGQTDGQTDEGGGEDTIVTVSHGELQLV